MSGHGLAIARALSDEGINVIGLEANRNLPGTCTRVAKIYYCNDINNSGLIDSLLALKNDKIGLQDTPVLFLTNDRMVRTVAESWQALEGQFLLSWSKDRDLIAIMLDKSSHEKICLQKALFYPTNVCIQNENDIKKVINNIKFPLIVKPSKPLSSFKVSLIHNRDELNHLLIRNRVDLPFLAQHWIPGDDQSIYFSALYLDRGQVIARFDGHKLRSRPMGHTTIAESFPNNEIFECAYRFFEGYGLSGPASLELKRDGDGLFWVIEPTVGRTDFWLGVCIANGVNLPLVEYLNQTQYSKEKSSDQNNRAIWFNEERDPLGLFWYFAQPHLFLRGRTPVFLYFNLKDIYPFLRSFRIQLWNLICGAWRRTLRLIGLELFV